MNPLKNVLKALDPLYRKKAHHQTLRAVQGFPDFRKFFQKRPWAMTPMGAEGHVSGHYGSEDSIASSLYGDWPDTLSMGPKSKFIHFVKVNLMVSIK